MAKPRIFISSTFYDLKQIRVELDKFIESLGYEPIRNEEGDIPYGKDDALQTYCYKEISNIDILISIIGSRYGSAGVLKEKEQEYSVSQLEVKTALKENKQVFVFIDKNVFTEYETYILNKSTDGVNYKYVDNVNIYKFIEEIKSLPHNNNITGFESAEDITSYLKEQFAGLFKQFMLDSKRAKETLVIKDIESTAKTLKEMVDYLKEESQGKDEEITRIIRVNHPIVNRLKQALFIDFNIYIEGKSDLVALLKSKNYIFVETPSGAHCWERKYLRQKGTLIRRIFIDEGLFDDGKLKYIKPTEWSDDLIKIEDITQEPNDDLPF